MNRLERKCLLASLSLHALLCVVLLVGPAFLSSKQAELDLPVLELIPDKLTDLPISGGGSPGAKPQPPAPRVQPAQLQSPAEQTELALKQLEARTKPPPERQIERETKPGTDAVRFENKRQKPKPQVKVEMKTIQRPASNTPAKTTTKSDAEDEKVRARAETEARRRKAQQILARINGSSERISENLSAGTTMEPLGPGGEAYANYAQVVKTYYDRAWIDPEEVSEDAATVKVKVVIARDGTVISDSIIGRSGIPALDKSVENALSRVRQLPPFPEGAKEAQRTFIINFNLKAKRFLG